jgi:hypothetical protein
MIYASAVEKVNWGRGRGGAPLRAPWLVAHGVSSTHLDWREG